MYVTHYMMYGKTKREGGMGEAGRRAKGEMEGRGLEITRVVRENMFLHVLLLIL